MRWKWRGLTGIRLEKAPDETTILNFRTGDGGGTHCAGSGVMVTVPPGWLWRTMVQVSMSSP